MGVIRVLIVDDQRVFVDALTSRLEVEEDLAVVGAASSTEGAISMIDIRDPDVVIVDLEIGGGLASSLVAALHERFPSLPLAVVSERADATTVASVVDAGARGFLPKTASIDDLVEAVRGLSAGESRIPPKLLTPVLQAMRQRTRPVDLSHPLDRLTPRELETLCEMMAGQNRGAVAERLGVSVNTVRTHVKHILAKLEVHSSVEAVSLAFRLGLRPPPAFALDSATEVIDLTQLERRMEPEVP